MKDIFYAIITDFEKHANRAIAEEQKTYLRNQFDFFGIKSPQRRQIQKACLRKAVLPPKDQLKPIVRKLWNHPKRECHYFAQEFVEKYIRQFDQKDISLLEHMITHQSWWDTVDFIATKLVSEFMKKYPGKRFTSTKSWIESGNLWLQRTAILFQLKYKDELDVRLLSYTIRSLDNSNEFFLNKAIGWILREYSKTDPEWVLKFVESSELSPLSRREALKYLL